MKKDIEKKPNLDNEKRYCKGCLKDVSEYMWCECGEFYLNKVSTCSEEELSKM